ncbi:hypothetical protein [Litchfieldia alkalitelluris]|uniref:hypothetical protein n=1 Tax=Litchfieldia alkalitelluris TaxID=304268 RepID=UPI000996D34A|nr:hypothetical protein [Litchfieldia alkalitelluris]
MDKLKVRYRLGDISFDGVEDLNKKNQEKIMEVFSNWEQKLRHSSAVHLLNQQLQLSSEKVVKVSVEKNKESQIC